MATGEIQLDNGTFRVTKWTIEPGGEIPMHTHALDYVVVPLVNDTLHVTTVDGAESTTALRIGESYARSASVEHAVSNRGVVTIEFIEIEKLA